MWIRQDVDWQHDPFVVTLDGCARHVLNTIWCLAAKHGTPTFDDDGEPLHAVVSLQFLEPSFLARESGFDTPEVIAGVEKLRRPIAATEWSPEIPARISVDMASGTATVRNVAKYQKKILKDRARKAAEGRATSVEGRRDSAEAPRNSAEGRRNETKRNETNETVQPTSSPVVAPATPEAEAPPLVLVSPAPEWPADLADVRKALIAAQAPENLIDPPYWRAIDEWLGKHPRIAYLDQLAKYLAWWRAQTGRKRHRNLKSGFRNWLTNEEAKDERAIQRQHQFANRPNELPGFDRRR